MGKMAKIFMVCFTFGSFCLGSFSSPSSGKEEIDLKFKGQIMSAELQGVSLRLILEKLNREKGIWSKGDESVLEEKVSVRVMGLPLLDGLRRILSDFNHVLVFDRDKRLVGLFVLGKKDPGRPVARDAAIGIDKALSSRPLGEDSEDPFDDFSETLPPGSSKAKSKPAENPFEENISPGSEDPFSDPFGELLHP